MVPDKRVHQFFGRKPGDRLLRRVHEGNLAVDVTFMDTKRSPFKKGGSPPQIRRRILLDNLPSQCIEFSN